MILPGGPVVGAGGFDLVAKGAEVNPPAQVADPCEVLARGGLAGDAFVRRGGGALPFGAVAAVLRAGADAQIAPAVVPTWPLMWSTT